MKYDFFLSGAITGTEDYRERFARAELALARKNKGARIWNPARMEEGRSYRWYMVRCLIALFRSRTVVMLPGWRESKGARAERAVAECLGLVIAETGGEWF